MLIHPGWAVDQQCANPLAAALMLHCTELDCVCACDHVEHAATNIYIYFSEKVFFFLSFFLVFSLFSFFFLFSFFLFFSFCFSFFSSIHFFFG